MTITTDTRARGTIAVTGDLRGHLQLALCAPARWQRELREPFALVLAPAAATAGTTRDGKGGAGSPSMTAAIR